MIFRNDMKRFFHNLTQLSKEGKRFFFLINYPMTEAMLFDLELMESDPLVREGSPSMAFDFGSAKFDTALEKGPTPRPNPKPLIKHPESIEQYGHRFQVVQDALRAGEISLINLTLATPIECELSLDEIFQNSKAKYRVLVRDHFVCFSPERFVHINKTGVISSHPMKGTISTSIPNAAQVIMNDPKEIAEHTDMVESMKIELARVGQNVSVPRFRYLDEIHTERGGLLQVSSEVKAELPHDWKEHLGEILQQLLPAGSIAGIPKAKALQIIEQAEHHERGYYSGISGYFNGEELDTSVMIRFIEQQADGSLIFHSGGGVTINSICEREYNEVLQKIYLPE